MNAKAVPHRQIALEFAPPAGPEDRKRRKFRDSLSAVEIADDGQTLFLGVDETVNETPTIERLRWTGDRYAAHQPLAVDELLPLPDTTTKKGRVGEIDIEGFAEVRFEALLAHATQIDPESPFWFGLPRDVARGIHPFDDYVRATSLVDAPTPEDDLFAGLRAEVNA